MKQLIYSADPSSATAEGSIPEARFVFVRGVWGGLLRFSALRMAHGVPGAVKAVAKLATHSPFFYGFLIHGKVVHWGWVTLGRCRHYSIERDDAVIGPIETSSAARGMGLAAQGSSTC